MSYQSLEKSALSARHAVLLTRYHLALEQRARRARMHREQVANLRKIIYNLQSGSADVAALHGFGYNVEKIKGVSRASSILHAEVTPAKARQPRPHLTPEKKTEIVRTLVMENQKQKEELRVLKKRLKVLEEERRAEAGNAQ